MRYWVSGLLLMLAACVPATPPPQLAFTPGAPVTVTGERVTNSVFSVARPGGWRVITSAADAPVSVIFVAPDDSALVMVARELPESPPQPQADADTSLQQDTRTVTLETGAVTVYAAAPAERWDQVEALMEQVADSVALPE